MRLKFWDSWDETEKATAVRIAGLCVAAFTIFALIASLSYLFNWKQDMSLLGSSLQENASEVANKAGSLGFRFGHFLISDLFGLGSFCLLIVFGALSARLIAHMWAQSLLKTCIIAVSGAAVTSLLFGYIGMLAGIPNAFGSGLGGEFGTYICTQCSLLFGTIVTGIFIFILLIAFLFLSSKRFTVWFSSLGMKKEADGNAIEEDDEEKEESRAPRRRRLLKKDADADDIQPAPEPETVDFTEDLQDLEPVAAGPVEPVPARPEKPATAPVADTEGNFEIIEGEGLDTTVKEPLKPIDNRMDPPEGLPKFQFPSLNILDSHNASKREVSTEELTRNNNKIRAALANYRIKIDDVKAIVGPTVTLYKVYPSAGVQIAQIKRLQEDIALSLNAKGVRVVTLSDSVGIEVANDNASIVPLRALLNDDSFRESKADLPVAIGYTITQKVKVFDLADAPHLLIAGATKQGKSVGLNVIVSSLLYAKHPSELKFVFIDPKMVEFSAYAQLLKHYLAVLPDAGDEEDEKNNAIVKNPKNAERILRSLCQEMDDRYELMASAGVNKVTLYNDRYKQRKLNPQKGHRYMPYLVCIVDEYADLTMSIGGSPETRAAAKSITASIIRLAQKGRAAGLHVILATQRPSVDVISGLIKSNFPMRIAFRVASRVDSMTILDAPGAEKLIGKGDMLLSAGIDSERIQCGYVDGEEIDAITEFIGKQQGYARSYNTPYYLPAPADPNGENGGGMTDMSDLDERFTEAAQLVVTTQKASTSYLQTKLGMGFAKAARVMGQLESAGIVGPQEGAKPRAVLIPDLNSLQPILDSFVK